MTNSIIGKKGNNAKKSNFPVIFQHVHSLQRLVLLSRKPPSGKLHPSTLPGSLLHSYIPALVESICVQDLSISFFFVGCVHGRLGNALFILKATNEYFTGDGNLAKIIIDV